MTKRYVFALLCSLSAIRTVEAVSTKWQSNPHGAVRLVSAWNTVPASGEILLGLHFKPAPDWYLYWKVPGESGYPPRLRWKESRGFRDARLLWPAPTRILLPGPIEEFGYDGETVYPIKAKLTGGSVRIVVDLSYLTCYTSCVAYDYTFTLDLPAGPVAHPDAEADRLIQEALRKVPAGSMTDEEIMKRAPTLEKFPGVGMEPGTDRKGSLLVILLLAFLGGVLLNVMPCVLPVLSIKLAGLLQHSGQSSSDVVKSSLASFAGILVSFEVLALVAILARRAGHAIGWGIQFQNPVFVAFLMAVVLFFALNLWGVFEIQMPRFLGHFATSYGYHETLPAHFVSGLLATLLATPCSAPYLGTAMGFALSQPSSVILMTFTAVGVGMALPYLALAAFPQSIRWLPKPGAWMVTLKKGFAILLFATAAWLGWVLYQQQKERPAQAQASSTWGAFDEPAIPRYLNEGRPVLVDVTADWCVTCKYNERFVLADARVMSEFAKRRVVLMKADWTNRDPAIGRYLMKYGRAGIPFYALYRPGGEPILLSEFLTVSQVLEALRAL